MNDKTHVSRGIVAGIVGGLAASWMMNQFMAGPGQMLRQALSSPEYIQGEAAKDQGEKEDATMKTADAVVSTVTGGKHLTWEERQKAGPVVHYAFGAIMGGLYGGIAEIWPGVKAGFGATFGTALFTGADLVAVPVLRLGPSPAEQPSSAQASPLAAHVVYGISTELGRRVVRALL